VPSWDRVKQAWVRAVGIASPRVAYQGVYRAVVVSQSGQTVDVKLDDPRLPGMAALPIQVGVPGAIVEIKSGARMLVAFENGDPAKPIALLWEKADASRLSLVADLIELGVEGLIPLKDGVLTGQSIDPFTSMPHFALGNASATVLAKGKP
jgi:hypothetical protein